MNNEIKINVPEGMEIDRENSTFECIKFKPKKKELPKTWEEFCKMIPVKEEEAWIDNYSEIIEVNHDFVGAHRAFDDANLLPSKEYAEAMLALCKLIQLRDCYNDSWKPDWINGEEEKYVIIHFEKEIRFSTNFYESRVLAFKTRQLSEEFYNNFRDLIEQAKLLL